MPPSERTEYTIRLQRLQSIGSLRAPAGPVGTVQGADGGMVLAASNVRAAGKLDGRGSTPPRGWARAPLHVEFVGV